jgi:hypothetical protein
MVIKYGYKNRKNILKIIGLTTKRKAINNKSPATAELFFDQLFSIYDDYPVRNKFFFYTATNI